MNSGTGAKDLRSSSRSGGAVRGEAVLMWLRVTRHVMSSVRRLRDRRLLHAHFFTP